MEPRDPVHPLVQSVHQLTLPVINKEGLAESQVVDQVTVVTRTSIHQISMEESEM